MKYLLILFSSAILLTGNCLAQNKPSYFKAVFLDSISGKAPTYKYDLAKPGPTLFIKDTYICKCEIKTFSAIMIRGKRPVGTIKAIGPFVNFNLVMSKLDEIGASPQPGDRMMITDINAANGEKTCLSAPGTTVVFLMSYK